MAIVRRNDPVRLFLRRLGMLALMTLTIAVGVGVWKVYEKERESRVLRNEAEIQVADLQVQHSRLESEIANLRTMRGKEAALREHYEMGQYGENLIIIVDPPRPIPLEATSTLRLWINKFLPFW